MNDIKKELEVFNKLIKAISKEEDINILEQTLNYYQFIKYKKLKETIQSE